MQKFMLSLTTCAALVACGGGGGDGKVTENNTQNDSLVGAAVALSASNYEPAAKEIVSSFSQISSFKDQGNALLLGSQMSSVPTPSAFLQAKLPLLARAMRRDSLLSGSVFEYSETCQGGGKINVVESDNNNNDDLDAGDSAVLTIENCMEDGMTISGKISFDVISGSVYSDLTANNISIRAKIQDFKVAVGDIVTVGNGSYTMTSTLNATNLRVVISAPSLTNQLTQAGTTKVFQYTNYTVDTTINSNTTTWSVKGKVSVPTLGANTAEIATLTPFSASNNTSFVTAGQLMITLSNGGKMRVTEQPMSLATPGSKAKVELDLNSDGTYEEYKLIPWIDIL